MRRLLHLRHLPIRLNAATPKPRVGPAGDIEADVLEFEATDVRPESRLACQIPITDALAGLVLHVVGRSR